MTASLKEKDTDRMKRLNRNNGYGLTAKQMARLIDEHEKGEDYLKTLIEYRLTDINFHTECALLASGRYAEARALLKEW